MLEPQAQHAGAHGVKKKGHSLCYLNRKCVVHDSCIVIRGRRRALIVSGIS